VHAKKRRDIRADSPREKLIPTKEEMMQERKKRKRGIKIERS
jgi:hypothetical protein